MGTVSGLRTRRYHGLLVVAGDSPANRRLGLASLDPVVTLASGAEVRLATHEWASGAIAPSGHELLESFDLDDGLPRWRWRIGDVVIERELAMVRRRSCLGVVHRLLAGGPVRLALDAVVTWRDVHGERHAGRRPDVASAAGGIVFEGAYRLVRPGLGVAERVVGRRALPRGGGPRPERRRGSVARRSVRRCAAAPRRHRRGDRLGRRPRPAAAPRDGDRLGRARAESGDRGHGGSTIVGSAGRGHRRVLGGGGRCFRGTGAGRSRLRHGAGLDRPARRGGRLPVVRRLDARHDAVLSGVVSVHRPRRRGAGVAAGVRGDAVGRHAREHRRHRRACDSTASTGRSGSRTRSIGTSPPPAMSSWRPSWRRNCARSSALTWPAPGSASR